MAFGEFKKLVQEDKLQLAEAKNNLAEFAPEMLTALKAAQKALSKLEGDQPALKKVNTVLAKISLKLKHKSKV